MGFRFRGSSRWRSQSLRLFDRGAPIEIYCDPMQPDRYDRQVLTGEWLSTPHRVPCNPSCGNCFRTARRVCQFLRQAVLLICLSTYLRIFAKNVDAKPNDADDSEAVGVLRTSRQVKLRISSRKFFQFGRAFGACLTERGG